MTLAGFAYNNKLKIIKGEKNVKINSTYYQKKYLTPNLQTWNVPSQYPRCHQSVDLHQDIASSHTPQYIVNFLGGEGGNEMRNGYQDYKGRACLQTNTYSDQSTNYDFVLGIIVGIIMAMLINRTTELLILDQSDYLNSCVRMCRKYVLEITVDSQ